MLEYSNAVDDTSVKTNLAELTAAYCTVLRSSRWRAYGRGGGSHHAECSNTELKKTL